MKILKKMLANSNKGVYLHSQKSKRKKNDFFDGEKGA